MSLSFGGRTAVGRGFGIPIVMRYALEFAATTPEAVKLLTRMPVHMSYSIAVIDRAGRRATVFVNPDRPAQSVGHVVSTNHQHAVEWPRHAKATRSVERGQAPRRELERGAEPDALLAAFLRPPVLQTSYDRRYGTLYTVVYRSRGASAELVWPEGHWRQSCADFRDGARTIRLASTDDGGETPMPGGMPVGGVVR